MPLQDVLPELGHFGLIRSMGEVSKTLPYSVHHQIWRREISLALARNFVLIFFLFLNLTPISQAAKAKITRGMIQNLTASTQKKN